MLFSESASLWLIFYFPLFASDSHTDNFLICARRILVLHARHMGSQTHWSLYDIGLISLYQNSQYISALRFQHITMLKLLQQSCHFNFSHFFICLLFWQSYITTHSNSNTVKKYEKVQYQNCQTSCHRNSL